MASFPIPKTVPQPQYGGMAPLPPIYGNAGDFKPGGPSGMPIPGYIPPLPVDRNKAVTDAQTAGYAERAQRNAAAPVPGTQEYTDMTSRMGGDAIASAAAHSGNSLAGLASAVGSNNMPNSFEMSQINRSNSLEDAAIAEEKRRYAAAHANDATLLGEHFAQVGQANADAATARQYESDDRASARNLQNTAIGTSNSNRASLTGLLGGLMNGSGINAPTMASAPGSSYTPMPISMPTSSSSSSSAANSPMPTLAPVDTSRSQSAAFSRAKDQVGQETSGSLAALRSVSGARGMGGTSTRGAATVIGRGQGELADVTRAQAIQQADLENQNATTNYQGGIAQRGQNIGRETAQNSLAEDRNRTAYEGAITQRGQDIASGQNAVATQNQAVMAQYQAQIAQRQQALQGLIGALSNGSPLY